MIYRGQVLAEGNVYEIRKLIDRHPHRIRIECDQPRALARGARRPRTTSRASCSSAARVLIETRDPDRCYDQLAAAVLERGVAVAALSSPDNNLGAVFEYLTGDGGRAMTDARQLPSGARRGPRRSRALTLTPAGARPRAVGQRR